VAAGKPTGSPKAVATGLALLIASIHTIRVVRFALANSSFHGNGDDIEGFWQAKNLPFGEYLLSPIDIHRLPLHRLTSHILFHAAPFNFAAGEAVLVAFHLAGCVLLFVTVERIGRSAANYFLVELYAMNPYVGPQLFWWTAGVARLPCIFFSTAAVFWYLRYRAQGARMSFVLSFLSLLLALGFFAKGVLVPFVLVALEAVFRLGERESHTAAPRRSDSIRKRSGVWALLAASGALSIAYVVAWRAATPQSLRQANVDPSFLLLYLKWSWTVFGLGAAGYLFQDASSFGIWIGVIWIAGLMYSIARGRTALAAWVSAAVLISTSMYMGTSQARANLVGPFAALSSDRYYLELAPTLVLFASVALREFRLGSVERNLLRSPFARWAGAFSAVAVVGLLEANSYRSTVRLFETNYRNFQDAHVFFANLRHDLTLVSRDRDGTWPFVDAPIPNDLVALARKPKKNSELLELMGEHPRVVLPAPGAYWITQSGRIVRM
jgi:hypothetical protein